MYAGVVNEGDMVGVGGVSAGGLVGICRVGEGDPMDTRCVVGVGITMDAGDVNKVGMV